MFRYSLFNIFRFSLLYSTLHNLCRKFITFISYGKHANFDGFYRKIVANPTQKKF